jgi:methyltransferase (TIGR00027 family)
MAKTGDGESLGTAEGAVLGRATHTLHAEDPVLEDDWAIELLGEASRAQALDPEHEPRERAASGFDFRLILAVGIGSLRYAEDEVEACVDRGVDQYVILGAGFDTFALRRDDLADRLRVFEVDFPDVQALKRSRIEAAARRPAQVPVFVPVDFETMSIETALPAAGFATDRPSVWSWMNTIPYLTNEATEATLGAVRRLMAPGSRIVLNYRGEVPLTPDQIDYLKTLAGVTSAGGEPFRSSWKPEDFERVARERGFRIVEHATEDDLNARYWSGRSDGMYAAMPTRLVTLETA